MRACQHLQWGVMLVAAGVLAGCGGSESSSETTWERRSGQPSIIAGREVNITTGADAPKPIAPEDFHRHDMQTFRAGWHQSYATASLKLLISAIGPKPLLDHLENYRETTQNPEEAAAAGRFIDIIHQAYNSRSSVDTEDFFNSLQSLAPFNRRNAAGDWEFKLQSDVFSKEKDPELFLPLISELFRLDTLAGWSFDIDETYVHAGQERPHKRTRNRFQMFQVLDLGRVGAADMPTFNLQKTVDLLHADAEAQVKWNESDAGLTVVKVRRQISIDDVQNLKRLTISLQGRLPQVAQISYQDPVKLPVLDRKTGRKMVLTLAAREIIVLGDSRYAIRILNNAGRWIEHDTSFVFLTSSRNAGPFDKLVNFAVTGIAPAP